MDRPVLVTGAAGNMGAMLRAGLRRPLRPTDVAPDAGCARVSVTDLDAVRAAARGAGAVVHLAGITDEDRWDRILDVNVHGTRTVLEAARLEGVRRVVLASSNHAAGFHGRGPDELPAGVVPRPDTYYGFSKAAGEALGSLYHDRFGMDVVCLRIGTCYDRPPDVRALSTWLSPGDAVRLVDAALDAEGFHVVWGVSANTRRWWSLDAGRRIGYHPVDDAEAYAAELTARPADGEAQELGRRYVGGYFCGLPLGVPPAERAGAAGDRP